MRGTVRRGLFLLLVLCTGLVEQTLFRSQDRDLAKDLADFLENIQNLGSVLDVLSKNPEHAAENLS